MTVLLLHDSTVPIHVSIDQSLSMGLCTSETYGEKMFLRNMEASLIHVTQVFCSFVDEAYLFYVHCASTLN